MPLAPRTIPRQATGDAIRDRVISHNVLMTPSLLGTGLLVVGIVVWVVCAIYAYRNAPKLGRSRAVWTILAVILGPIALMVLYVLPKKQPVGDASHSKRTDPRDALYEVPKKKR